MSPHLAFHQLIAVQHFIICSLETTKSWGPGTRLLVLHCRMQLENLFSDRVYSYIVK